MAKRLVRSWDVFDTLIARKCGEPHRIFDSMALSYGEHFVSARARAEVGARALKPEIVLDDIYDQLQVQLGWSQAARRQALEHEIRLEFENVIPIAENMARVGDGDIVVSDMYLPREVISELLRAAGLDKNVALFVSTNGKADGTMWRRLRQQFYIRKHTGDNPRSDVLRPLRHGIPAGLTEASAETPWERLLRCNGAPALGSYVREMRLRTHHPERESREIQRAQIEANFPLLLLSSAALIRWCRTHRIARALMSSRDCVLWAPLAEKLATFEGTGLAVEYFLISRVAALRSSAHYLEYAAKRLKADSVVVDLSMTGVSLAGLADRLGIQEVHAFVIAWHQSFAKSLYGDHYRPKAKVKMEFITAEVIDNDMEALNQAATPSIHDVHESDGGLAITYGSENRSKAVLDAIAVQDAVFAELVQRVPDAVLAEALEIAAGTRLVFLVRESARQADRFNTVISRAQPGAALWNDPNGVKLNLAYASGHPLKQWVSRGLKRMVKPLVPPGSALHRHAKILRLILQILKNKKVRNAR